MEDPIAEHGITRSAAGRKMAFGSAVSTRSKVSGLTCSVAIAMGGLQTFGSSLIMDSFLPLSEPGAGGVSVTEGKADSQCSARF